MRESASTTPRDLATLRSERSSRAERRARARRRSEGPLRRELASATAGPGTAAPPDLERRIAELWAELLQRRDPDVDENFFEVGGDSRLLAELHVRLNDSVAEVSLVDLFQHPTIASLARHLAGDDWAPRAPREAQAPEVKRPAAWKQSGALKRQRAFMERRRSLRREAGGAETSVEEGGTDAR